MKYKACLLLAAAAISTPSVHCIPNFKSVLNFLKWYPIYKEIKDGEYAEPQVQNNSDGSDQSALSVRDLDNLYQVRGNRTRGTCPRPLQLIDSETKYTHCETFDPLEREKIGEEPLFCVVNHYPFYQSLLLLKNKEGKIVDCGKPCESNIFESIFMTERNHREALYKGLICREIQENPKNHDKLQSMYLNNEWCWTKERVFHPVRATAIRYAVIAGSLWLGYKLCKKLFGKTKKPAPAKGAAKGKRVTARAVS